MLAIESIEARGFRNLADQAVALHPRFNVIAGDNGQGKTNLLEAIYVATTTKSFRTSALVDCVKHGSEVTRVRARVVDDRDAGAPAREQRVDLDQGKRVVRLDGKRPRTHATFALATPVVLFEPASLALSQGAAGERRKLVDRVAVHLAASWGGGAALLLSAERYRLAHHRRKKALESGWEGKSVEPFERMMAEHGAALIRARRRAIEAIAPAAIEAFQRIAKAPLELSIVYAPRAPEDEEAFAGLLAERRAE
ncbi:MAG: AAA family ATPase, partial [Polyangiales bacterium]